MSFAADIATATKFDSVLIEEMGVRVVMLTGDRRATAEATARLAGITDVEAEVRPEDKARTPTSAR